MSLLEFLLNPGIQMLTVSVAVAIYFLWLMLDPENWSYEFKMFLRRVGLKPR